MDNIYVVKEGDNLSEILQSETGNGSYEQYTKVAKENGINDPNKIYVGQEIDLSSVKSNTNETSSANTGTIQTKAVTPSSGISSSKSANTPSSNTTADKDIVIDKNFEQKMMAELGTENKKTQQQTGTPKNPSSFKKMTPSSNANSNQSKDEKVSQTNSEVNNKTSTTASSTDIKDSSPATKQQSQVNTNSESYTTPYIAQPLYEVCCPSYVKGFEPKNNYFWFIVKGNAGEEFVNVNNCVKNCCADLEEMISDLNGLKNDMGENTGTLMEIDNIINGINIRKEELIQKNKELINACEEIVQYVYENKASKADEAAKIATTIAQIKL